MNTTTDTRAAMAQAIEAAGLTIRAEFVPYSKSRHAGDKWRCLNWRVTLQRNGRDVVTTDYSAGIAHCPAYKLSVKEAGGRDSLMRDEMLTHEIETGKTYTRFGTMGKGDPAGCRGRYRLAGQ